MFFSKFTLLKSKRKLKKKEMVCCECVKFRNAKMYEIKLIKNNLKVF